MIPMWAEDLTLKIHDAGLRFIRKTWFVFTNIIKTQYMKIMK